jgi:hypothetical protein
MFPPWESLTRYVFDFFKQLARPWPMGTFRSCNLRDLSSQILADASKAELMETRCVCQWNILHPTSLAGKQ